MEILIIVFLILLNGIFSMSEIALVSSRKFKLEGQARKGSTGAKKALALADNPNTFLSTVQIGITLIGILTGIYSGEKITDDLEAVINRIPALQTYAPSIAVGLVVIILTYFSIVFGELLPKRIGLAFPEKVASFVAAPMELISKITKPFIWLLAKTNDMVLGALGIKEKGHVVTEEEITSMIHESKMTGEIQDIEHDIVKRVFVLGDRKVRDLMTHRLDLTWLDIHDNLFEIRSKVGDQLHSVYPVARKNLDNILGVVNLKQLFVNDPNNSTFKLEDYLKKPVYVHEHLPAYSLLEQLKQHSVHSAIVVDEYGAIEGMVTMYDVLDALVGDQVPQHPEAEQLIQRDENSWLVDGQYSYYDLLTYFGIEDVEEENFTTLAGLILSLLNHIPVAGEKVEWHDFELEVVDMDDRKIDKVLITRRAV